MRILALTALAALVASLVLGGSQAARPAAAWAPGAAAAQQVFLDPITGLPRDPTAAELAALQAAGQAGSSKAVLRPGAAAPEEIHLPDGTAGLRLDERYHETIAVCRQPDGRFGTNCPAAGGKP